MALGIIPPKIKAHQENDGTWTATLYIEGKWWAQMTGFASQHDARRAIKAKYL